MLAPLPADDADACAKAKLLPLWALGLLLIVPQVFVAFPRMSQPFGDGRMHRYFDSAKFSIYAAHCTDSTIQDWRKWLGVARYRYNDANEPDLVTSYGNHPVLAPATFALHTRVFGHNEWSTRLYALFVSLIVSLVLYAILRLELQSDWLALGLTYVYLLAPQKFGLFTSWRYESMAELAILSSFLFLRLARDYRYARYALLVTLFLAFHSDFPAFPPAVMCVAYLCICRKENGYKGLWPIAAVVALAGLLSDVGLQLALGYTPDRVADKLADRTALPIGFLDYVFLQLTYLRQNLGIAQIALALVAAIYACIQREVWPRFLTFCAATVILTNVAWLIVFRGHSAIHPQAQWYLGSGFIFLFAAVLPQANAQKERPVEINADVRGLFSAWLATILLCILSIVQIETRESASNEAAIGDNETIRSIDAQLIVFPDGVSGPVDWWKSYSVGYYTDPVLRKSKRVGVRLLDSGIRIDPREDVFVVLNKPEILKRFNQWARTTFGATGTKVIITSPTFAFARLVNPASTPVGSQRALSR